MFRNRTLAVVSLLFLASVSATIAQVSPAPSLINFQGRLTRPDGTPVSNTTTQQLTFRLYAAQTGGTPLWTQINSNVVVRNGTFSVILGTTTFPATLFNGDLWLEVQVGSANPLTPRQQLVSVAYALKANSVPDGAIGTASLANSSVTGTKIAAGAITADKFASNIFNPVAWLLGGNSGTNPSSNFLGTTDGQPLIFRTNNAERMRMDTSGRVYIGRANGIGAGRLILSQDTPSYTGMYIDSGANGLPFYGYTQNGTNAAWTMLDGSDGNQWKLYNQGFVFRISPQSTVPSVPGGPNYTGVNLVGGHPSNSVGTGFIGNTVWGGYIDNNTSQPNTALNHLTTVSGGGGNTASGLASTVSGGVLNIASGTQSVVIGGFYNRATNRQSVVLGGGDTQATGAGAIAAGDGVIASGLLSTAIGGSGNVAQGDYSQAAGYFAKALHNGTFVWSDATAPLPAGFASTGANQYLVRATGGVGINTNSPTTTLDVNGNIRSRGGDFLLNGRGGGFGYNGGAGRALVDTGNGSSVGYGGLVINFFNDYGRVWVDSDLRVIGAVTATGGFINSDARYKKSIAAIENPLETILRLHGVTYEWDREAWRRKNFPSGRQVGFIAQEIEKVLPELVNTDEKGYKSVAYANVVPVLIEAVKVQQKQIETQKAENAQLKGQLNAILERLTKLEQNNR